MFVVGNEGKKIQLIAIMLKGVLRDINRHMVYFSYLLAVISVICPFLLILGDKIFSQTHSTLYC